MDVPGTVSSQPRRMASTQFLLLDSADRNQSLAQVQPWNNFSFQKPQALIDAFADHVLVTELVFPWNIPNITTYNNRIWINEQPISVIPGFYTPDELVTALNISIVNAGIDAVFSYDDKDMTYTFTNRQFPLLQGLSYYNSQPGVTPVPPSFYTTISLFKTMGFTLAQSNVDLFPNHIVKGNATLTQYTAFVDIVSNRLMRYTSVKDGESAANAQSAVICRVYACDEISIRVQDGVPQTSRPFVIHRQYKTPKSIQWNKDSFVDYVDIQVIDQWNNLVYLPETTIGDPVAPIVVPGAYPDFQISLLCSED